MSWRALQNSTTGLLLFLGAWFVLALVFPPYIIPAPAVVFGQAPAYLTPVFLGHLALTLYRVLAAFVVALAVGSAAGVLAFMIGKSQHLNSLMLALEVIPGTILGIILLLALGLGSAVPIALATLLTVPTIAINTANALAKKNPGLEQYLVSTGAGTSQLVKYLYVPALVPTVQSNLSIGFGLCIKVVVLGEFIGAQDGIGYLLNVSRIYFNMKEVFFYLSVILLATALFQAAQGLVFSIWLPKYFYPE